MNPAYNEVLSAGPAATRGLFDTTASRLDAAPQNIEKDFWVCWTLDALFHGLPERGTTPAFQGRDVPVERIRLDQSLFGRHRRDGFPG